MKLYRCRELRRSSWISVMLGLGSISLSASIVLQLGIARRVLIGLANLILRRAIDPHFWNQWLTTFSFHLGAMSLAVLLVTLYWKYKQEIVRWSQWARARGPAMESSRFLAIAAAAVAMRFLVMTIGHNDDFEAYQIVGEIVSSGGNVYAETSRYNYGPAFSLLQGAAFKLASSFGNPPSVFRTIIVSVLTIFDISLAYLLYRRYKSLDLVAILLLNPISVIITGYHNQFDNVAVFLGYLGCSLIDNKEDSPSRRDIAPILLLSLSLITKHILFVLPAWLFLNATLSPKKRILYGALPVLSFFLSFVPYLPEGYAGIRDHVFLYRSTNNFPLLLWLVEGLGLEDHFIWYYALLVLSVGILTRRTPPGEQVLYYLLAIVSFSSAISNQYLAIPVLPICVLGGALRHVYFSAIGMFLVLHRYGLNLYSLCGDQEILSLFLRHGYSIAVWILFCVLVSGLMDRMNAHERDAGLGFG